VAAIRQAHRRHGGRGRSTSCCGGHADGLPAFDSEPRESRSG
jgi:hypothetical protein